MKTTLPLHGPIVCRNCWPTDLKSDVYTTADQKFRVVNDPGAWGSAEPRVLVLGISKGFTQARAFAEGDFDSVPFKDCRGRLKEILMRVGLLGEGDSIDAKMSASEQEFAWGSLVRCSLSGWNDKKSVYGAGTPDVLPAFKHPQASDFLSGCMRKFLNDLPDTTRLVVLLGNAERYINELRGRLSELFHDDYEPLNEVSHRADGRVWVHVAHPSRGNGYFSEFVDGHPGRGQGRKRALAIEAVRTVL